MIPSLPKDKHGYLAQALAARTKYARVLWRMIKGKRRFFVQLVQEGLAPMKYQAPAGTVGADVGPSMIAVYSERGVALVPLCPEIEEPWAQTKRLRRKMDRSRRATNPECY